jgi:hypothetical protein
MSSSVNLPPPPFITPPPPRASLTTPFTWDQAVSKPTRQYIQETIIDAKGMPLTRCLTVVGWEFAETKDDLTATIGDSFLVERDEYNHGGKNIITDYITTRTDNEHRWSRYKVSYFKDTPSPYPYQYDRRMVPNICQL